MAVKNTQKRTIVVIGGDHHNTLGVIRSLGEQGINPILILVAKGETYIDKSRYIKDTFRIHSYLELIDVMKTMPHEDGTAVIACSDQASSLLDANRHLLLSYRLPGTEEEGGVTKLMNKQKMIDIASKFGLTAPRTWVYNKDFASLKGVTFPCIIKPLVSKEGSKEDIKIVKTKDELFTLIQDAKPTLVQEYIDKDYEFQLIGLSSKNMGVIIPGVSIVLRPSNRSNTGYIKYLEKKSFEFDYKKAIDFIKETRYFGLFSMEFIHSKNGNVYFLEVNFRNDGNAICVTESGVNLPYLWYLDCYKNKITEEMISVKKTPVYIMPEITDWGMVKRGQVSFTKWIRDLFKTSRFMEFSIKDIKPFFALLHKLRKK